MLGFASGRAVSPFIMRQRNTYISTFERFMYPSHYVVHILVCMILLLCDADRHY